MSVPITALITVMTAAASVSFKAATAIGLVTSSQNASALPQAALE